MDTILPEGWDEGRLGDGTPFYFPKSDTEGNHVTLTRPTQPPPPTAGGQFEHFKHPFNIEFISYGLISNETSTGSISIAPFHAGLPHVKITQTAKKTGSGDFQAVPSGPGVANNPHFYSMSEVTIRLIRREEGAGLADVSENEINLKVNKSRLSLMNRSPHHELTIKFDNRQDRDKFLTIFQANGGAVSDKLSPR